MSNRKGFTIIEVMVVLAIAGFIVLVLFLALSAAQRNARNAQRHRDAAHAAAFIKEYYSLAKDYPDSCNNMHSSCGLRTIPLSIYDNKTLAQNNVSFWHRTTPYQAGDGQLDPDDAHHRERVAIRSYAKCDGGSLTGDGAAYQSLAVQYVIETATGGILACRNL